MARTENRSSVRFEPLVYFLQGDGTRYIIATEERDEFGRREVDIAYVQVDGGRFDERYARLFATAPDLLTALKDVEWSGQPDLARCPQCLAWRSVGHKTACALANAIAKATGAAGAMLPEESSGGAPLLTVPRETAPVSPAGPITSGEISAPFIRGRFTPRRIPAGDDLNHGHLLDITEPDPRARTSGGAR